MDTSEGARIAAEYVHAAKKQREARDNAKLLAKHYVANAVAARGIHFIHVRALDWDARGPRCCPRGGITLAWSRVGKGRNIKVAVAAVHANDCYNKATGRLIAVNRFLSDHTITLHVPKNTVATALLQDMFTRALEHAN